MTSQVIQDLVSHCLPKQKELTQQLISAVAVNNDLPNAVVYGAYNSGKSSLLNSLTGNVENEYFATRDIPETRTTKQLKKHGVCYIDTPGLDVNMQDTSSANEAAFQADIVLLVHKLSAGPIQQQDLSAMQKLAKSHGEVDNILFVLTEAESVKDSQPLIDSITQQVQESIAPKLTPYLVSNLIFKKGVLNAKTILINKSGIPELLQDVQALGKQLSQNLQEERNERITSLRQQLLNEISLKESILKKEVQAEIQEQSNYEDKFVQTVKSLRDWAATGKPAL